MMLYHKDIGFPAGVSLPAGTFRVGYTHHARRAAGNDRYGVITLPVSITLTGDETVELELDGYGTPIKAVVRLAYDRIFDVCLVIIPDGTGRVLCKTVWLNQNSDQHGTLQAWRYARP